MTVTLASAFYSYSGVTAQATIESVAGQPVEQDGAAIATDPWTSMYPG